MQISRVAFAALALTTAACGGQNAQQPPAGPPEVSVLQVQSKPVSLTTELPGRTSAYETSEVRPQVNGLVLTRLFQEGDSVSQGQALYRIDPSPYTAQAASARAALARAKASIASTGALQRRYGELVKINAISRQDYENAVTGAQQAQADVAAQQAALRTAEIDLGRTTIRAPISGRIGRSITTTGALVTAGQANPLTTIQRLDPIYVDITQSSTSLLKLRQDIMAGKIGDAGKGARVRLRLEDGSVYAAEGVLKFTDVTVDPGTGSQVIRAVFPNPNGLLLPGMYVRAEFSEGTESNGLLVPQRAVSRDEKGNAVVLIVDGDNKLAQRALTTSRAIGDNWLVNGGLKAGDRIVMEGAQMLQPGTPVKAIPFKPNNPAQAPAAANAKAK